MTSGNPNLPARIEKIIFSRMAKAKRKKHSLRVLFSIRPTF
ncbi:hypothetical protein CLOSTASPAR_05005 [[Clostridium] asparagiforme DSM 15981]|uniref:Uncharacterized protein n=1 Tax=[Clostridium] asparagiforme DSM 15981 TaxID=518636 RepID=C0D6V8_9FIRM|nr:hypothetical protein CLOSTASPAR_05005 [[Clostridium] asparagiforme DSM 15981]